MGNAEFYAFVVHYWDIYTYSLLCCAIIYYLTYKSVFISLLDPLNFNILFSCLGASVVLFLFWIGEINLYYFSSFCLTQLVFMLGFFIFKPIQINRENLFLNKEIKMKDELFFLEVMFVVSSMMNILCQLYVYAVRGIPFFMESYLDTYNVGGGFGILSRIITGSSVISWYLLIHFLINKKGKPIKFYLWFYMCLSLTFFSLNGSKGTFLTIGLILFLYSLINYRYSLSVQKIHKKIEKFSIRLFGVICVLIIVVISLSINSDYNPFIILGIRLLHSGDAYFYGYPNDVLMSLPKANGFYGIFSDFLGMFRIINWEKLPQSFGMSLVRFHYPGLDVVSGANARHNIFGLFYFGYFGSIIFSFILGISLSFCRNYLYRKVPNNTLMGLLYILLYFSVVTFESDICLALFMLDSYLICVLVIFPVTLFMYYMIKIPSMFLLKGEKRNRIIHS